MKKLSDLFKISKCLKEIKRVSILIGAVCFSVVGVAINGLAMQVNLEDNQSILMDEDSDISIYEDGKELVLSGEIESFDNILDTSKLGRIIIKQNFKIGNAKKFSDFLIKCPEEVVVDFTNNRDPELIKASVESLRHFEIDDTLYFVYKDKSIFVFMISDTGELSLAEEACQSEFDISIVNRRVIKNLILPKNCVLNYCSWEAVGQDALININQENPYYIYEEGVLYNKEKTEILYINENVDSLKISNNIKRIVPKSIPSLKKVILELGFRCDNKDVSIINFLKINSNLLEFENDKVLKLITTAEKNQQLIDILPTNDDELKPYLNLDVEKKMHCYREFGNVEESDLLPIKKAILIQLKNDYNMDINEDAWDESIEKIKSLSKLQRAKSIYSWICENIAYNEEDNSAIDRFIEKNTFDSNHPVEVFKNKYGICRGYSALANLMMRLVEVPCLYVGTGNHAFNLICIEDTSLKLGWGIIDTTWGSRKSVNGWMKGYDFKANPDYKKDERYNKIENKYNEISYRYFPTYNSNTLKEYNKSLLSLGSHNINRLNIRVGKSKVNYISFEIDNNIIKFRAQVEDGKLVIPDEVLKLGFDVEISNIYEIMSNLKNIEIPKNLKFPNDFKFENNWTIIVDKDNPYYTCDEGILYNKEKSQILCVNKDVSKITLSNDIKKLPSNLRLENLKNIVIEKDFKIDNNDDLVSFFSCCSNIGSIEISKENLNYIYEEGVLYNKERSQILYVNKDVQQLILSNNIKDFLKGLYLKNAKNIVIEKDFKIDNDEDLISFFSHCPNLELIEVSKENANYIYEEGVLYNKEKNRILFVNKEVEKLVLSNNIKDMPKNLYLKKLKNIIIGKDFKIDNNNSLVNFLSNNFNELIEVSKENPYYTYEEGILYNKDKSEILYINNDVETLSLKGSIRCSLSTKSNVEKLIIEKDFNLDCDNLIRFLLYCPNIESIEVSEENLYYTYEAGVLYNKDKSKILHNNGIETLVLSKSMNNVSFYGFKLNNLKNIIIEKDFEYLNRNDDLSSLFSRTSNIESIEVSKENLYYIYESGVLYNKEKSNIFFVNENVEILLLTNEMRNIGFSPRDCKNLKLKNIVIEKNCKIDENDLVVFLSRYPNIESIEISEGNPYYTYKEGILYNKEKSKILFINKNVEKLTLSKNIKYLPWNLMISKNSNLKNIIIEESFKIEDDSYWIQFLGQCSNIESFEVSKENPYYTFEKGILYNKEKSQILFVSKNLEKLILSDNIKDFACTVFRSEKPNLKNVIIEKDFKMNKDYQLSYLFEICVNVESITVDEENLNYIYEEGILYNKEKSEILFVNRDVEELILSDNIKEISPGLRLLENSKLKNIVITKGFKSNEDDTLKRFFTLYPNIDITVEEGSLEYKCEEGVIYNKDKSNIVFIPKQSHLNDFPIYAVYEDFNPRKIIISNNIKFDSNDFFVKIRNFYFGFYYNIREVIKFENKETHKNFNQFISKYPFK